jgi:hypothetical protein
MQDIQIIKEKIMINRVQAFNNKSNYRQNFGMAVDTTPGGKKLFNNLVDTMGASAKETITGKMAEVTEARKGDKHVDITVKVHSPRLRSLFSIGVHEKGGKNLAIDNGEPFYHVFSTSGVEADELIKTIDMANNFAANAEKTRAMRGAL